jgi:hypothetical protein
MTIFRRHYGAGPLHLLSMLACLAFAAYLLWTVLPAPDSTRIVIWVGGAAVAHDLVLWPLYAITDRLAVIADQHEPRRFPPVPWINHLRVPSVLAAVTLLISFPLVLRHSERTYHVATGLTEHPYLGRWLLLTASAFALSTVIYGYRLIRALRRR